MRTQGLCVARVRSMHSRPMLSLGSSSVCMSSRSGTSSAHAADPADCQYLQLGIMCSVVSVCKLELRCAMHLQMDPSWTDVGSGWFLDRIDVTAPDDSKLSFPMQYMDWEKRCRRL